MTQDERTLYADSTRHKGLVILGTGLLVVLRIEYLEYYFYTKVLDIYKI